MAILLPHTESLYAALELLPDGYRGEIIGGRLHTSPRPAAKHVIDSSWKLKNEFNADDSISAPPFTDVALKPPWS